MCMFSDAQNHVGPIVISFRLTILLLLVILLFLSILLDYAFPHVLNLPLGLRFESCSKRIHFRLCSTFRSLQQVSLNPIY